MTHVAIIVLNWNQAQLTIETINSILTINTDSFKFQIYLVDNGSDDNSLVLFSNTYKQNKSISILETGRNLGYVGGNNFGIKKALKTSPDYVLVINNDVIVNKNFLKELLTVAATDKNIGLLGPKIYFAPGHEYQQHRYHKTEIGKVVWSVGGDMDWNNILGSNRGIDQVDNHQFDNMDLDIDFISGCCFLVKTEIFKKIGFLDDKYFMYLEDADFCQRIKKAGYKIAYVPKSIIWHINAGSSSIGGPLHDYFLTRNRLLFGFRYASLRTKLALFRDSIQRLFVGSQWQKTGIIDFYFGKLGKGSWQ
ncbi:MAG: glycosyltransferase family 2 protein [Patescibacteria group bacterium]